MKQQYDSYKPSGIDWIGDIPSHWDIRKTSQLFFGIGSGTTPTSGNPKYYSAEGINWLQTGDLNDGKIIITSKKITETAIKDFSSLKIYPKGSIVIAMYGATIGKLGILNIETTTNQACCVLPYSNVINQNYAFYVYLAGKQSLISSAYGGGQPNISQDTIKSFKIPIPPLAEQEAIAAWLDEKCGEIDAAIAKVDREIELIDELKQSEISRVVTHGLNPDAPLRPSGIDWIGNIPRHWEIRKTSQLFHRIGSGTTPTSGNSRYYSEDGINWLQTGDLNDGLINNTSKKITEVALNDFSSLKIYPKESIVIAMYGATIGKLGQLNIDTTTNQACCVLPYSNEIDNHFAFFAYWAGKKSLINSAYGGGQPNISQETIKSFKIALPPLTEQEAIADYLDKKCAEIDGLKAKLSKKRETLSDLRQSIISEVMTGKRKVI